MKYSLIPSPWTPLGQYSLFLSMNFHKLPSSSLPIVLSVHISCCTLPLSSKWSIVILLVKSWVQPSSYYDLSQIEVSPLESYDPFTQKSPRRTWYHFQWTIWCVPCYLLDKAFKVRRKSLGKWIYSSIYTYIHLNMRSNMVWRIFACDHSTQ